MSKTSQYKKTTVGRAQGQTDRRNMRSRINTYLSETVKQYRDLPLML